MKDTGEILNPFNLMGNGQIEREEGKKNQNSNPRGWCAVVSVNKVQEYKIKNKNSCKEKHQ